MISNNNNKKKNYEIKMKTLFIFVLQLISQYPIKQIELIVMIIDSLLKEVSIKGMKMAKSILQLFLTSQNIPYVC